jgi:hypothetical protein
VLSSLIKHAGEIYLMRYNLCKTIWMQYRPSDLFISRAMATAPAGLRTEAADAPPSASQTSSEEAEMRKATTWLLAILLAQTACSASLADGVIKGGVQQTEQGQTIPGGADYPSYPQPVFVPQTPQVAPPQHHQQLNGGAQQNQQPRPPVQMQVQQQQTLPQGFLGRWNVQGQRTKVEAITPEFQSNAEAAFQMNTNDVWNINGNPGNYTMSNSQGVSTQIMVDKVEGGTAFIRYPHRIRNTMAQEAIVMSLTANGLQFNGLERISIVKEGLPQPRAKVTYSLMGSRR